MKPRTRHKRRILRYRRRNLIVLRTFKYPPGHSYGYQIYRPFKFDFRELLRLAPPALDWKCPYKYDPHTPACQGYHLEGCDLSCDRVRQMQLRREGKI